MRNNRNESLEMARYMYKKVKKSLKDLEEFYDVDLTWNGPVLVDEFCFYQGELENEVD